MPHTSSAKKRLRQTEKRRTLNRTVKKQVRVQVKAMTSAAADTATTVDALKQEYNLAAKRIDKAAAKGVIHKNTAARKKSQLARLLNAKVAAGATPPPA
jgi:small subunit ribosomal protein S20